MTIELTPHQERLLQESVRNGCFASIDEALNHLFQQLTPEAEHPLER